MSATERVRGGQGSRSSPTGGLEPGVLIPAGPGRGSPEGPPRVAYDPDPPLSSDQGNSRVPWVLCLAGSPSNAKPPQERHQATKPLGKHPLPGRGVMRREGPSGIAVDSAR